MKDSQRRARKRGEEARAHNKKPALLPDAGRRVVRSAVVMVPPAGITYHYESVDFSLKSARKITIK